tara:strand:+ start:742 stop:1614 length:873 start_codon:yes stop_codon:yes gene_type:complete
MFFDEEMLLDLRLNIMDKYVDKFVITEATYMHNGNKKKLNFDISKFKKFKDKIIYIVVDQPPPDLFKIYENDNETEKENKFILNGYKRDNYQREKAQDALNNIQNEDWIIINDIDEIPNLKNINFKNIKNKFIIFKQKIFYYKFNLLYPSVPWYGSRACKKKDFISPQWLRNIKHRKYPSWRLDTFFSKKKYSDIFIVDNGGWHFTNIKTAEDIEKKLLNYAHHFEFEQSGLKLDDLKKKISEKKIIYDHNVDQRGYKWGSDKTLKIIDISDMPEHISKNIDKYSNWLDN